MATSQPENKIKCHCCGAELLPVESLRQNGQIICGACAASRPAPKPRTPYDIATASHLTGDWGGLRTRLSDAGITITPLVGSGLTYNTHGGLNTEEASSFWGYSLLGIELDLGKMKILPGATLFVQGISSWGDGVNGEVGALNNPNWFVGSYGNREFELERYWYRQRLLDDRIEIRIGKIANILDLFDRNDYAANPFGRFMNQALVYLPMEPIAWSLGAFVRVWPTDWLYLQGMVVDPESNFSHYRRGTAGFDTTFHGNDRAMTTWEFGLVPKIETAKGCLPGHYRFGAWQDPHQKQLYVSYDTGSPKYQSGDLGWYVNFDQLVWKEQADPRDSQGLGVFGRFGFADGDVNPVSSFWSAGLTYEGLLPMRNQDKLGFGIAQSLLSEDYGKYVNARADKETVFEAYYAIPITPSIEITPDIQFIANPGGCSDSQDALIAGVRIKILF